MLTATYMDGSTQVVNPHPAFFVRDKDDRKNLKDKTISLARALHFSPLKKVTLYRGAELVFEQTLIKEDKEPKDVKVDERKVKRQAKREFKVAQRHK